MLIAFTGCEIEWVSIQIGVDWLNCGGWLINKLCCFGFQSWNVAFVCLFVVVLIDVCLRWPQQPGISQSIYTQPGVHETLSLSRPATSRGIGKA